MGTDDAVAAPNPESPAEGPRTLAEETVSRLLRSVAPVPCPDDVRSRLRATLAGEVELRRAIRVEPKVAADVKPRSALWSEHTVHDD